MDPNNDPRLASATRIDKEKPFMARVCYAKPPANGDLDWAINVVVSDHVGMEFPVLDVKLVQSGFERQVPKEQAVAFWMPYQKGQAAKTEEAGVVAQKQVSALAGVFDVLMTKFETFIDQYERDLKTLVAQIKEVSDKVSK